MSRLRRRWTEAMMDTYGTPALALTSGEGAVVRDADGKAYLDMLGGIAVNALGHAHPAVVEAVTRQISTLGHVSNLYISEPSVSLAELLLALSGRRGRVFFANSGSEANEAAFKISRRTGRAQVVAAVGGFHGRTMGALALTGQPPKTDPFQPLPPGVTHVPYGDIDALRAAVSDQTAMVILEPIQGESGVITPPAGYLAAARAITVAHGALLAFDEVQTGVGRTGHWYAHQAEGVEPDVMTLAKGLGGGLPLGACVAFGSAAALLTPGSHASTFGGNPVSCAAALAVLRTIARDGLLDHVKRVGERLRDALAEIPGVTEVRGAGLLLGVVLDQPISGTIADDLRERGFLAGTIGARTLRLAPPLIITAAQANAFVAALAASLAAGLGAGGLGAASEPADATSRATPAETAEDIDARVGAIAELPALARKEDPDAALFA